jgi:hypothetical protein
VAKEDFIKCPDSTQKKFVRVLSHTTDSATTMSPEKYIVDSSSKVTYSQNSQRSKPGHIFHVSNHEARNIKEYDKVILKLESQLKS